MNGKAKADGRRWHVEEYISGRKALCIGRRTRLLWYRIDRPDAADYDCPAYWFGWGAFKSADMYHAHLVLFGRVLEFHYFRKGV